MIESMRVRGVLVALFLIFCAVYLLPNFVKLPDSYPLHKKHLNYGLDIQGGAHLVYGVDVKGVLAETTERTARAVAEELKVSGVDATVTANEKKDGIVVKLKSAGDLAKAEKELRDRYGTSLQIGSASGDTIEAKYYDAYVSERSQQIINQAIEVIRNRVDEFGVAEPVIAAQGRDRILVQLPSVTDPTRAKELINRTAKLDFRIVSEEMPAETVAKLVTEAEQNGKFALGKDGLTYAAYMKKINDALKGKIPPNTGVFFEKAPQATTMEAGKIPLLLKTDGDVSGALLEDARVSQDQYGKPNVSFRFGPEGRKQFGALTSASIGKRLAIVLDQAVYSAPVIQSRIDAEGQITLNQGSFESAQKEGQLLATVLRAGALPAALQQLEERSVGPSLGSDSIERGKRAALIGIMLVVVFTSIYYRTFGVVASVCLGLNLIGLLAVLSALGATLTLPGIAGVTLTIGMAVDANVIIYERIKEEIARGITMKAAIRDGFAHAFTAIFDSQISTGIAAAVLIYFGSGPVRGFGVTLIAGIVTTMITAVFVTRYLLDLLVSNGTKHTRNWI